MTRQEMMNILKKEHERLGSHPTREALHTYNELQRDLLNEVERTEAEA